MNDRIRDSKQVVAAIFDSQNRYDRQVHEDAQQHAQEHANDPERRTRRTIAIVALVISTCASLLLVPDLTPALATSAPFSGIAGGAIALAAILVIRARARDPVPHERKVFAAFLFLMPSVYLAAWIRSDHPMPWIWIEIGGQLAFGAMALTGWKRAPWLLAVGIGAHGLLWDAWHVHRTSYMPDWYAVACAIVDVGWAIYAALELR